MDIDPESNIKNVFIQVLSFGFSFLDDAILLGLSNLGIHCQSLEWISKILLACTVLYWTRGIWIGFCKRYRFIEQFGNESISTE